MLGVVDGGGVAREIGVFDLGPHGRGDTGGDLAHAPAKQLAHLRVERAQGAAHDRGVGDDVRRIAGQERADGDHSFLGRVHFASNDGLQRGHDLGADGDGVNGQVRLRAVVNADQVGGYLDPLALLSTAA